MKQTLLYLWQLPQNICGVIYWTFLILEYGIITILNETDEYTVVGKPSRGCVTLGRYIFISPYADSDVIKHEVGHTKQSLILGPLYLLVIGLPSLIWASTHKSWARHRSYYWFYTEKWANKLMGLDLK